MNSHTTPHADRTFVVEPQTGWFPFSLRELGAYRELLYFLAWRDVKVRYQQTLIGAVWAVLQPLLMMAVFAVVFGKWGQIPSDGVPYPLFAFAGLLPWQLFSSSLATASTSLVTNQDLIKKVYFPRILAPISSTAVGIADFMVCFVVLLILLTMWGVPWTWRLLWLPAYFLLTVTAALGASFWLSALNARFRDIQLAIPLAIQLGLFASPIAYSSSAVPEKWRLLYAVNPMVGVVDGIRWCVFGATPIAPLVILISIVCAVFVFVTGLIYFQRVQDTLADVL